MRAAHPVAAPSLASMRLSRRPRRGAGGARLARAHEPRRRRAQLPRHLRARARRHARDGDAAHRAPQRGWSERRAHSVARRGGPRVRAPRRERSGNLSRIGASCCSRCAATSVRSSRRCRAIRPSLRRTTRSHSAASRASPIARCRCSRSSRATSFATATGCGSTKRPRCRCNRRSSTSRARSSSGSCSRRSRFRPTFPRPRSSRRSIRRASRRCGRPSPSPTPLAAEIPWRAATVPGGFKLSVATQGPIAGSDTPVEHLVYSDGLATVSVFIEDPATKAEVREGFSTVGSTNAYSLTVSGRKVTAMGEVPRQTVRTIASSLVAE